MSEAMIEGLVQVISSLKKTERRKLINRLVESRVLSEDQEDRLLLEERKHEPSLSYREVRSELKRK